MKQYLIDTCICVFLFRQKFGIAEKMVGIYVRTLVDSIVRKVVASVQFIYPSLKLTNF